MKKNYRIRIVLLLVCLVMLMLSAIGAASAEEPTESGSCGTKAIYTITGNKTDGFTLTITGTGSASKAPWRDRLTDTAYNYRTTITKVVIGEGITGLKSEAFMGMQGIEEVSIPNSLKSLPQKAFKDCIVLRSIDLNQVATINSQAFQGCGSLSSVTANSLKTMYSSVFVNCNLTEFTFSANFSEYDGGVFAGNPRLTTYRCVEGAQYFSAQDGMLYSKDGKTLVGVPPARSGAMIIPSSVTTVGAHAFYENEGITSVTVPATVTELGFGAFYGMKKLQKVTLNCACEIPQECFGRCVKLTDVNIGNGVTGIDKVAFNKTGITAPPELPESVLFIHDSAFDFDLDGVLPERFQDREGIWCVISIVPVLVTEDYDAANAFLAGINSDSNLRGSMQPLKTSEELSAIAMRRAAEISIYCDSDHNPIRPDGTNLADGIGSLREVSLKSSPDVNDAIRNLKNDYFQKSAVISDEFNKAGIGCVTTGAYTYWVIILVNEQGGVTSCGSGNGTVIQKIEYAEYLVSDVSVNPIKPFSYTGEEIRTTIMFEGTCKNGYEVSCTIAPDYVEYSIANTAVVALDEYGMPWGVGAGTTQAAVRFAGKSYPFEIYVSDVSKKVSTPAVLTYDCTIGDAFGIGFLIPESLCNTYQDAILIVSVPQYSGNTETGKRYHVVRDYEAMNGPDNTPCRKYNFYGIAAKEMTSRIDATFCGINAGDVRYYNPGSYSIADYAIDMFPHAGSDSELKTLLADMLYYGAEAQKYFNYHTGALATANMSNEMKNCATSRAATVSSSSYTDEGTGVPDVLISGVSLSLENRPSLNIYLTTDRNARYMSVEIQKKVSPEELIIIPSAKWTDCGNGQYRVEIAGISALDFRTKYAITCVKDGNVVSNRVTAGVEGYAYLAGQQGRTVQTLTDRLLRFGDAAVAYRATR